MMRHRRRVLFLLLVLAWLVVRTESSSVHAQVSCQVNATENYPRQVLPGQRARISTLVAGSCVSPFETIDSYVVRVDITSMSRAILSSNSSFTGYGSQTFSVTVLNTITAPLTTTSWTLGVNVYVSVTGAGEPNFSRTDFIVIQVGVPPTTATISTITTLLLTTIQPRTTTTQTEAANLSEIPSDTLEGLAILLSLIVLALAIVVIKSRKHHEKTRVY